MAADALSGGRRGAQAEVAHHDAPGIARDARQRTNSGEGAAGA